MDVEASKDEGNRAQENLARCIFLVSLASVSFAVPDFQTVEIA